MLIFIAELVCAWLLLSVVATPIIAHWVSLEDSLWPANRRARQDRPTPARPLWGSMVRTIGAFHD